MKVLLIMLIIAATALISVAQSQKIFPYEYKVTDMPNGLRVVTVPTDYPNLVSLYIVVQTGSRNEVEPNKSGYAHFFEHLMFRGSENYPPGSFDRIMQNAGASSNAYTSSDQTVYHETFAKEDLDEILRLEADRFKNLKFSEEQFKTEAGAVLGEYNKNSASPTFKMYEVLRETAFNKHTYSHTTMGYLADIKDYPNQYEYAWKFFNRFYRPEYTTIVVVGDFDQKEITEKIKSYFGDWKRGDFKQQIPVEPPQTEAKSKHIEWDSPTLPHVVVAYRGPAFSETEKDKAALDLLNLIAFGNNSDIYQKLVLEEQKAVWIDSDFGNQVDPELFAVYSQIKEPKDLEYVQNEIIRTFQRYTSETIPQKELDETRSRLKYGFALGMNSNSAIAGTLARFISLKRSPDTIDKLFALYDSITPADMKSMAAKYFKESSRTIITLDHKNSGGTK
ncbi:MAG: insulinase family protein [Pyrinomonadaceae bacterium]|nr:insulinase family protein [Pyrinomonadaceae bacterium]